MTITRPKMLTAGLAFLGIAALASTGIGCRSEQDYQDAQAQKATYDPPYAKGTFGTPMDPAYPYDSGGGGGGGGGRRR